MKTFKQIGPIAERASRASHNRYGRTFGMLALNWPLVIGEKFAQDSHPEKLMFPKGENINGQLTLAVNSYKAIYFQQIQKEMIERINTYLGYKAIDRIRFIQKRLLKSQPKLKKQIKLSHEDQVSLEKKLELIQDDDTRNKLKSIGEYVYDQHSRKSA